MHFRVSPPSATLPGVRTDHFRRSAARLKVGNNGGWSMPLRIPLVGWVGPSVQGQGSLDPQGRRPWPTSGVEQTGGHDESTSAHPAGMVGPACWISRLTTARLCPCPFPNRTKSSFLLRHSRSQPRPLEASPLQLHHLVDSPTFRGFFWSRCSRP